MRPSVRATSLGLAAGLVVGLTSFASAFMFSGERSAPPEPLPSFTPSPVLASCTDTLDVGAGPFNLTHVEVTSNGKSTFWNFSYDGPRPISVEWSSLSKRAGTKHVLAFGATGDATALFVRDLRTGRKQDSGIPVTFGGSEEQSSYVSMAFPTALANPRSFRGAVAAVTVPGGRTDSCVLR